MFALKAIFSATLLFSLSLATLLPKEGLNLMPCDKNSDFHCPPVRRRIKSIKPGVLKVPVDRQSTEEVNFAVESTSSGFGRVTRVGVSVQIGVTATMDYDITVTALSSRILSTLDEEFRSTLNETELTEYESLIESYEGGLNVPYLEYIGINLATFTDLETQRERSEFISNYNEKSSVVEDILETVQEERLRITGTIQATGVSFVPVQGFAFIKIATIEFEDGSTMTAVTTDSNETEAGTIDGSNVFPSTGRSLNVIPFIGE